MLQLDACLENVKTIAIAGHVNPDGDCAGSCLAVYNYLYTYYMDIRTDLFLQPISEKFLFLQNSDKIQNAEELLFQAEQAADAGSKSGETAAGDQAISQYDLFIALDCGDRGRLGVAAKLFDSAKKTLCIDHHKTNDSFADTNYVFPGASSTCELVYGVLPEERVTKEIAECLYLGIVHDTGVFQYSCTSRRTMEIAGRLMEKGIDSARIVDETYYIKTYAQQRIWGKAMQESRLHLNGTCISAIITKDDMDAYGVDAKALDGVGSTLRSTEGVEVSIFLYETKDGYKISLRSRADVDVAEICREFGGGGHARAAGASVFSKHPEKILNTVLEKIKAQMKSPEDPSV